METWQKALLVGGGVAAAAGAVYALTKSSGFPGGEAVTNTLTELGVLSPQQVEAQGGSAQAVAESFPTLAVPQELIQPKLDSWYPNQQVYSKHAYVLDKNSSGTVDQGDHMVVELTHRGVARTYVYQLQGENWQKVG